MGSRRSTLLYGDSNEHEMIEEVVADDMQSKPSSGFSASRRRFRAVQARFPMLSKMMHLTQLSLGSPPGSPQRSVRSWRSNDLRRAKFLSQSLRRCQSRIVYFCRKRSGSCFRIVYFCRKWIVYRIVYFCRKRSCIFVENGSCIFSDKVCLILKHLCLILKHFVRKKSVKKCV